MTMANVAYNGKLYEKLGTDYLGPMYRVEILLD